MSKFQRALQWVSLAGLLLVHLAPTAQAALITQLGGQVVFETERGLTWLADANLAATNTFGLPVGVDLGIHPSDTIGVVQGRINADGTMNWPGAMFWIDAMNAANYLGFSTWRLPLTQVPDPGCTDLLFFQGFGCTGGELGHLFYEALGATEMTSVLDTGLPAELAKFTNIQTNDGYWSATIPTTNANRAYGFRFLEGRQNQPNKRTQTLYGWAVVPEPGATTLVASTLAVAWIVRRRCRA